MYMYVYCVSVCVCNVESFEVKQLCWVCWLGPASEEWRLC